VVAQPRQLRAARRRNAADLDRGGKDARPPGTTHSHLREDPASRLPREPSRPTAVESARRKLPNDQGDIDAFRRHLRLPRRPRNEHQGLPDAPSCFVYVLQSRVAHDQAPGDELSKPLRTSISTVSSCRPKPRLVRRCRSRPLARGRRTRGSAAPGSRRGSRHLESGVAQVPVTVRSGLREGTRGGERGSR
jgi:hypothetical protein